MILTLLIWKMASEFFYPHYELFEWVERGGSYGTLIALWFAIDSTPYSARKSIINNQHYQFK
jgi:hypothetical protein